jgi:hypothetical protein
MEEITSREILDRFELIKEFFMSLGFSEPTYIERGLDSFWGFNISVFHLEYKNESRACIQVMYQIIGGVIFVLSGKITGTTYEHIYTDYDFRLRWEKGHILQTEFRDFKLKKLINN